MPRRLSASTPGRIAAAITNASRIRPTRTRSFQRARASATTPTTTAVATKARRAVSRILHPFYLSATTEETSCGRRSAFVHARQAGRARLSRLTAPRDRPGPTAAPGLRPCRGRRLPRVPRFPSRRRRGGADGRGRTRRTARRPRAGAEARLPARRAPPGVETLRVIEVSRLTKRYGETTAVDGLSFRIERGRITGFLGPNGAGKTTTLRILLGLARPTAGEATIRGRPYRELETPLRTVGAVFEASGYHPRRSGRNHLRVLATAAGIPWSRIDEVLRDVGLLGAATRPVGAYSLGMRQRLAVAAALLGEPELLVLDEPANGLDPEGIRWLREFLRAFAARGGTVFVSSHVLAEMSQLADEAVIIPP